MLCYISPQTIALCLEVPVPAESVEELLWKPVWMCLNQVAYLTDPLTSPGPHPSPLTIVWGTLGSHSSASFLLQVFCPVPGIKPAPSHQEAMLWVFPRSSIWLLTPMTLHLVLPTLTFFPSSWTPSRGWVLVAHISGGWKAPPSPSAWDPTPGTKSTMLVLLLSPCWQSISICLIHLLIETFFLVK